MRNKQITMLCDAEDHSTLQAFCKRKGMTLSDATHCAWDYFLRASDDEQDKIIADYRAEYSNRR